ncbi:MAG: hypothetical protein ACYS6K_13405 [Planctomycetota bacterium]
MDLTELAGLVFLTFKTLKVSPFDFAQDILYHLACLRPPGS